MTKLVSRKNSYYFLKFFLCIYSWECSHNTYNTIISFIFWFVHIDSQKLAALNVIKMSERFSDQLLQSDHEEYRVIKYTQYRWDCICSQTYNTLFAKSLTVLFFTSTTCLTSSSLQGYLFSFKCVPLVISAEQVLAAFNHNIYNKNIYFEEKRGCWINTGKNQIETIYLPHSIKNSICLMDSFNEQEISWTIFFITSGKYQSFLFL